MPKTWSSRNFFIWRQDETFVEVRFVTFIFCFLFPRKSFFFTWGLLSSLEFRRAFHYCGNLHPSPPRGNVSAPKIFVKGRVFQEAGIAGCFCLGSRTCGEVEHVYFVILARRLFTETRERTYVDSGAPFREDGWKLFYTRARFM